MLSTALPYKCYPMQTFPNLFTVSPTNPVTQTRTRNQIRHFTWLATYYTIVRVWNLVCCTKSDAEIKRQDVAEKLHNEETRNLPISAIRSLPWRKETRSPLLSIRARQQLNFTRKLPNGQQKLHHPSPCARRRVAMFSFLRHKTDETGCFFWVYYSRRVDMADDKQSIVNYGRSPANWQRLLPKVQKEVHAV